MLRSVVIISFCVLLSLQLVTADDKSPSVANNSPAASAGAVKVDVKRSLVEPVDQDASQSVRTSGRARRDSDVTSGLSPAAVADYDNEVDDTSGGDDVKRSRHYVRFGRDPGRHYVRFGRSGGNPDKDTADTSDPLADDGDQKRSANRHYVRFGRSGRHYVRFGRSPDLQAVESEKRAGNRHYVRFGRNAAAADDVDDALNSGADEDAEKRSAGRHYVRFGRSSSTSDDDIDKRAGRHYVRFGRSGQQAVDDEDKRAAGKHYVRFGRGSALSSDAEKRSRHYVRFGRSGGQLETAETGGAVDDVIDALLDDEAQQKRANYVRFG